MRLLTFTLLFVTLLSLPVFGQTDSFRKEKDKIFANELCTELKKGITQKKINSISDPILKETAQQIFDKNYPLEFRIQDYEAYATLETLAKEMKTSYYNRYENPTGMYFESGSTIILFVGDTQSEPVSLRICDFENRTDELYALKNGYNKITIKNNGLGYIHFYTDNYKNTNPVKIHVLGGMVNGYFDKNKHKTEDWLSTLDRTVYNYIDIKGDYINLCYTVDDLKKYCSDGIALINYYDKVVELEYDLMGLYKYNRVPKNHMFARTTKDGLFADGIGAGFGKGFMHELVNIDKIHDATWTIAHELGHVNQIRPGLKWVSTTEVTNNVYSSYIQHHFTPNNLRLEHERINDGDGNNLIGGRFNSYLNYGVIKGDQWLCQKGPDKMKDYEYGGDHFVKLCPLWQLMLYYRIASKAPWAKPDWYGDIAEIVRNTDDQNMSNGQHQLNFMKNACDVIGEDLTDFFIKSGMLKPIDKELDDYTRGRLTITQKDCDNLVKYASKYPKPQSPVIYYLSGNSVKAYENKKPVTGVYKTGLTSYIDKGYVIIDSKLWQHAVAYETYSGDTLTKASIPGTGYRDCLSTEVSYPLGSTRIEAVSWDGRRTLVYGAR